MQPIQPLFKRELERLGPATLLQAEQVTRRLRSAGYTGPVRWDATPIAGLVTLGELDPAAWSEPPAARELATNESARGPKQAPVSITGSDLGKLSALACRLEREAGEGG